MGMLDTIKSGKESRPPRIMIYGAEGIGKSTFAASAPNPVFIQTEDGLGEIDCSKFPLATKVEDVTAALTCLRDEPHNFQTVVIDSADWLEQFIFDKICDKYGVNSIEKADGGFGRGYYRAFDIWKDIVKLLQELHDKRNMTIILVAHAAVKPFKDPENSAYDRYIPKLHIFAADYIVEWADAVFFANKRFRVSKENDRSIASPIGANGGDRVMRTISSPACVAKNRYGLPQELPLSWQAFVEAYTQASGGAECPKE